MNELIEILCIQYCKFRRQCNGFVTDSFSYTAQTTGRREGHP